MAEKTRVNGEMVEKWHLKDLPVEEGDRVRFTYTPPKKSEMVEKCGTVVTKSDDTVARVEVDDAGQWLLKHGAMLIVQEGRSNRYHGSLIDVQKIPAEGEKVIGERDAWDKPVVGEVTDVNLETDNAQIQREFDPTVLWVSFDNLTEVK